MSVEFGLIVACLGFVLAAVMSARSVFSSSRLNVKAFFTVSVTAIVLQLFAARESLFLTGEIHFSIVSMSLLVSAFINALVTMRSFKQLNLSILLVAYSFSALLCLILLFVPVTSYAFQGGFVHASTATFIHIVLSVSAYCILVIASLYALQFSYIDAKLKAKTLSLHSHLPPLNLVEAQQFRLLVLGLILLTSALLTGFVFLDDMWSKGYVHKTILSLIAWAIFMVIAVGHKLYGWRNKRIAVSTIIGAFILTLAYFGSRFVKEVLLN